MKQLITILLLSLLLLLAAQTPVWSAMFYLPENGDTIVGQIQHVKALKTDTLSEIAQRYDIGYNEIVSANPDVDPWLPAEGAPILIPSRFILPPKPWRGIVINLAEMRLYYFPEKKDLLNKALVYSFPIGIGRESWSTPLGTFHITEKIKDPVWTVPQSVLDEARTEGREIPWQVSAGENNPLGQYAMLLDAPGYMLHGTNKSAGVGRRVSHGCIRLYPEDIEQLIAQVPRGTDVRIVDQPVAYGVVSDVLYVKSNRDRDVTATNKSSLLEPLLALLKENHISINRREYARISSIINHAFSLPVPVKDLRPRQAQAGYTLVVQQQDERKSSDVPSPVYSPMVLAKVFGKQKDGIGSMQLSANKLGELCEIESCYRYGPYTSHDMAYALSEILRYGFNMGSYIIEENHNKN